MIIWLVKPLPNTGEYGLAVVQASDLDAAKAAFAKRYSYYDVLAFEFRRLEVGVNNEVIAGYFE